MLVATLSHESSWAFVATLSARGSCLPQTHCQPAQLDLVRLGSAVLWKMHHCRYPPDALLHAQLAFHPGGVEQARPVQLL